MSLLSTGLSALTTNQTQLATTSHNISNVNTEGYSRQRVDQIALPPDFQGSYYIGTGVTVSGVERLYDEFLATQLRTYTSQQAQNDAFAQIAGQISDLLGASTSSLATGFDAFFNAANAVANDPTSIAARQVLLSEAESLTNRFQTINQRLLQIDSQIDGQISISVDEINVITQSIAELNKAISEVSQDRGSQPNDLLDQRDQLINRLAEYVSVSTVKEDTGAISVFIGNGQALVVGQTQVDLNTITDNSTDPPRLGVSYGDTSVNITRQITGGSLGGVLQTRGDIIDNARSELDALAVGLIDSANTIHQQGVTLDGNIGGNLFGPIPPSTLVAGAGNIFVAITDPRDVAAAYPVAVRTSATTSGTGAVEISSIDIAPPLTLPVFAVGADIQFTYDATTKEYTVTDGVNNTTFTYDPAVDSGKTVNLTAPFVELTVKLSGVPVDGDQFTIGNNTAVGDNRNALALASLRTDKILAGGTQSLDDAYDVLIADVATRTNRAEINSRTQQGLLDQVQSRFSSVSGVNLDEEAANLIRYQQAYQAASQIITVSNTVFNSLLSAL